MVVDVVTVVVVMVVDVVGRAVGAAVGAAVGCVVHALQCAGHSRRTTSEHVKYPPLLPLPLAGVGALLTPLPPPLPLLTGLAVGGLNQLVLTASCRQ